MNNDISRRFDVHVWSEHPEVNTFVNSIYEQHFKWQNPNLIKKHIKLVLLDLYLAWNEHPNMKLGVNLNNNAYKAKSRYNELHISKKTITVVKRLHELQLINMVYGFNDPTGRFSKVARIWSTQNLINQFKKTPFKTYHIHNDIKREVIILRNSLKKDIEYDDNDETHKMRSVIIEYNKLINRTFIDIPELDKPIINSKDKYITISSSEKFTRRIFNNETWEDGGRFYGGWWQRVPSFFRSKIYINDKPTIEDDYSTLHPILLYANKGINYLKLKRGDAYDFDVPDLTDKEDRRTLVKTLLLIAINAKDETSTFRAVKSELQNELPYYSFTFNNLRIILTKLKEKHPEIADDFCTGKGLQLMNLDGKITDYIIDKFTQNNIPILCIHDSFVVPFNQDNFLRTTMNEGIKIVTNKGIPNIDRKALGFHEVNSTKHLDRDLYLERINNLSQTTPNKSRGYLYRKQLFKEYSDTII